MPTIALVDDDRNILTSVSIALEAEGYRITTYTDGASALDGFKTTPPDLAILTHRFQAKSSASCGLFASIQTTVVSTTVWTNSTRNLI